MGVWDIIRQARRAVQGASGVVVQEDWRGRELRFKSGTAQSRMSRWWPDRLEVDYTRTMLGALLRVPNPQQIGMVGLGGGSQAKFIYRQLPDAALEVFEIDAEVLALRRLFRVPDDDARLRVHQADAAAALASRVGAYDLLLVDGYDVQGIPKVLSTQRFYNDARDSLRPGGVLAVNLYDTAQAEHLHRLGLAFGAAQVVVLEEPQQSNRVAFAWRGTLAPASAPRLRRAGHRQLAATFERLRETPFGRAPGQDALNSGNVSARLPPS